MGQVCGRIFQVGIVAMQDGPRGIQHEAPSAHAQSYSFNVDDSAAWLAHLRDRGYVVLRSVADAGQVEEAKALFWTDLEERHSVSRDDVDTWRSWTPTVYGLLPWLAQSAGAWAIRGLPRAKHAFEKIWGESDLIVSMDCVLLWLPWWVERRWRPQTEGLHLDQNPFSKPAMDCVQGMVPLLPVTKASGGLQVVPDSHLDAAKTKWKLSHEHQRFAGDWCPCRDASLRCSARLLLAEPGDLILWDSRTVHGGLIGTGEFDGTLERSSCELARLSVPIAMTPRAWADEKVQRLRREGFERGANFNHCPHEAGTSTGTVKERVTAVYIPIALTAEQAAVL